LDHLHVEQSTGNLLSISQGRLGQTQWSIVATNPTTGQQTVRGAVPGASAFVSQFGGAVFQGVSSVGLFHTFKNAFTDATTLALLDPQSAKIIYKTDLDLGVNADGILENLIYISDN